MSAVTCHHFNQCELWYTRHQMWLTSWLLRRVDCNARAEDLCHDTFAKLLGKNLQQELTSPRAYLTRIAHGLMVDECRRRDLEQAFFKSMGDTANEHHTPCLETQQILLEKLLQLDQLLDGLSPQVRQAFVLFRLEGLKQREIAQHLDVSLSSVEKYIHQAMLHCYHVQYG